MIYETDSEGLHKISLLCEYDSTAELEACIQIIKDFGIYADRLNKNGFRLGWEFRRKYTITCEDGVIRDVDSHIWSFDNKYKFQSLIQMAEFQNELEEKLRAYDRKELYQLSSETDVYDETGQLIEWESLPLKTKLKIRTENGLSDAGYDDIRVFSGAFPIKDFYTFCNELHLQVNGDVSDYTIALTEENETHNYRFSYSFYDDIGFYYLKDGEKKYDYIWSFSLGYGLVSEITGMSLSF